MNLFLDIETTFQTDAEGRTDPSPYIKENYLVSAGWSTDYIDLINYGYPFSHIKDNFVENTNLINYGFFKHNDAPIDFPYFNTLQNILNTTTLLIAHNAKFELAWLRACGFKYNGYIACTQIREYVLARGQKLPLNLKEICIRENLSNKKSDLVDGYLIKHIGFEAMPWEIVQEYGIQDVISLKELYYNQIKRLDAAPHLWPTVHLMEEFCQSLVEIEENGIKIDVVELDRLEAEYKERLQSLKIDLKRIVEEVMGATPINLDSPEQVSQLIYSRKVIDKKQWKAIFNLGSELRGAVSKPKRKTSYTAKDFVWLVKNHTEVLYKTTSEHCDECNGTGKIRKIKKDGSDFSRDSGCKGCDGRGFSLIQSKQIAGLRCIPRGVQDTAVGGFSTDKDILEQLRETTKGIGREFIEKVLEVNKIEVYLNTFIVGIRRGLRGNNILHTSFMQCVTATGRLSSRNPNFQNLPRGLTFPVKKAIVSRWENGHILEVDFSQLEFRVAGILSNDPKIKEDILNKVDIHLNTAKVIGCSRQDAKKYSFAPLYGSNPNGKPEHIANYYRYFIDRYNLEKWHNEWATDVISTGGYILPSGRELCFPNTKTPKGGFSNATAIKNYKVQSFATADIVPMTGIILAKELKQADVKSKIILTVHDSFEIDVFPGEEDLIVEIVNISFNKVAEECLRRFNYKLTIPLDWEIKIGQNWLDAK